MVEDTNYLCMSNLTSSLPGSDLAGESSCAVVVAMAMTTMEFVKIGYVLYTPEGRGWKIKCQIDDVDDVHRAKIVRADFCVYLQCLMFCAVDYYTGKLISLYSVFAVGSILCAKHHQWHLSLAVLVGVVLLSLAVSSRLVQRACRLQRHLLPSFFNQNRVAERRSRGLTSIVDLASEADCTCNAYVRPSPHTCLATASLTSMSFRVPNTRGLQNFEGQ